MSAFTDMAAGSRDRCRTSSVVSGKQLEWTAFKSKERADRCVLLATVREHQKRAALSLETTSFYETSPSANGSAIAAGCYLDQRVLDKGTNLRLEAEHAVQRQRIDELGKEKEQARRNDLLKREKRRLKSDLLEEINQNREAEWKVIEERNLRLEAEQVVQSKRIDELEKDKEQARRNDLLEQEKRVLESDLLKDRILRLEAEQVVQSKWIDELEKEKEQARRNLSCPFALRKSFLKSGVHSNQEEFWPTEMSPPTPHSSPRTILIDLLKERNQGLEADSKVIEERNLRLEAEQVVQSKWIDELEKEKEQAHRNDLQRESDLLKERNQRLEAESKVIEERNLRLEAEQVVQSKWIDELEKEKEQAHRNDLQRESDLLKERNQRLEAEIHADSHLNHTLKVCS